MLPKRLAKDAMKTIYGSGQAREEQAFFLRNRKSLGSSLQAIESQLSGLVSKEAPVFVFSAGWRSGSTMLQRLVMSGNDTLIWGEAYDRACIIQRLTETLFAYSSAWPPESFLDQPTSLETLSGKWVANLYPPMEALKSGYRAMLENLFAMPAKDLGALRWGFKEVRLGVNEARFLHWLFPEAKFLFIYRNPFDAYRSYKGFAPAKNWYVRWPDKPAFTPSAFAKHWQQLTVDFLRNANAVNGMLIKYEDLVQGRFDLDKLAEYCQLKIDESVLEKPVGSSEKSGIKPVGLTSLEQFIIKRFTSPTAGQLGYFPD